ncbi:MAG: hypothetical protein JRN11_06875 [Nitrososphaerota archaeon]|nr:hypothetical protein [Nitrososphaerota archaeon]MDG7014247.1 hypothetical protein [Nitrososphaerota archaeon]MDG7026451.1 hypothetical protein [Nitrososphaerota archaeon]
MSTDQGVVIAKRSLSLTKSYPVIGIFLTVLGAGIAGLSYLTKALPVSPGELGQGTTTIAEAVPFIAVPLQSLAAIMFATPVLLLFVYDKNNGVLEYLLSLGMDQGAIYRKYLEAALILAAGIVAFDFVIDATAGVLLGIPVLMLQLSGLVTALGLSAVAFGSLLMMSFSSLQKQRVGSNQPLGMALGVFVVLPSYVAPFVLPQLAFAIDLGLAALVVCLSAATYFASSRLISREKLLP